ncbi:MAG: hypothetical protein OEV28_09310 [Nitrospirota bacterium]|nr:hypothetical protein [Nitrospirota bacterium]
MLKNGFEGDSLSLMVLYLVPARKAREALPDSVEVEEVMPGMTVGCLYASRYGMGEGFVSELGIAPAFVHSEERKGFYLSRLLSNGTSGICGQGCDTSTVFCWQNERKTVALSVSSGGQEIVSLRIGARQINVPVVTTVPFLMANEIGSGEIPVYRAHHLREFQLASVRVSVPAGSPLAALPSSYKLVSIIWEPGEVAVWEPRQAESRMSAKPRIIEV